MKAVTVLVALLGAVAQVDESAWTTGKRDPFTDNVNPVQTIGDDGSSVLAVECRPAEKKRLRKKGITEVKLVIEWAEQIRHFRRYHYNHLAPITHRVDSYEPQTNEWRAESDFMITVWPGDSRAFAEFLSNRKTFAVKVLSEDQESLVVSFSLDGMAESIAPILETCGGFRDD